ncbi:hypothetical protein MK805_06880 [Shimazuella sp. AN120528]|uniref:hypothetical protein n=1 Tax=Shimazuella soli TaxID=1892854 RepID=UPI001F10BD9F|nr:hypothetical protein [Shimazuella soli]MCH5584694.1 hypothetical protein [Shimazuella soli]
MSRKFRKWKRPEWLTLPVMMAMAATNTYLSQNHFINSPFSMLMQQHGLEKEIASLNTVIAGVAILSALVTMITRGSWVKLVVMIACLGNAIMMFFYPWSLSQSESTMLYVIRCIQILLDNMIYGGVYALLRMVASEDRQEHKKTMALDGALLAVSTSIAKFLGFWLIDNPMSWAVFGAVLNLFIIPSVWRVKLSEVREKTEEKTPSTKQSVRSGRRQWFTVVQSESKQWGLAFGRQIPTVGNSLVFILIGGGGYLPLFIHEAWLAGAALTTFSLASTGGNWLSAYIPKAWGERGVIAIASIFSIGSFQCLYWTGTDHSYFLFVTGFSGITYGVASNSYGFLMNRSTDPDRRGIQVGSRNLFFAGSSMLSAFLFGCTGIHRDLWLWGSVILAGSLLTLPFIKYPPFASAAGNEGEAEDKVISSN